jgi:hypothetical protein
VSNTFGGLLLNGASINIPELDDELNAVLGGNDLSDNVAAASFSFGLRLFILRRELAAPGDVQSSARIDALVQGNRITGTLIGVSIDAGFSYVALPSFQTPGAAVRVGSAQRFARS